MSRSFAEAVMYNDTYSSMFGGDLVSEALPDRSLSWGIWQDAPSFHEGNQFHHGNEHTSYNVIVSNYEEDYEEDYE